MHGAAVGDFRAIASRFALDLRSPNGAVASDRHARASTDTQRLAHPRYVRFMATMTRTYQVDDLDGSEDDVRTVMLALDGTSYEIDLSADNADRLREKLERFIAAGKQAAPQKSRPAKRGVKPAVSTRDQAQAIRDWAKQTGYEVSGRGRISRAVQQAFDAAH